ncbi:hypothetical protein EWH23_06220 [Meiothermus sp. PNK-Is4]|nr:hypothetical protein DNA98_05260 [Meiothermus sp. Pnk-1]RYM37492.1 hypothetical protein EWH23_06220 [Meiothermus sp. PNK-Is4]
MSELEEILKEAARKVLGLPTEAKGSVSSLKKALGALSPNFKETLATPSPDKQSAKNPPQATIVVEAVEVKPKPPSAQPDEGAQKPAAHDRDLLHRLRESQKKLQKKADEAEKLRAKLQKEQRAVQEAQSAKGRALEEAAHLRKDLSRVAEERDRLSAELAKVEADKEALEGQLEGYKKRVDELEARVRELEGIAVQKEHLEAQLAGLSSFKETLPEPFPQEALLRVLVLDYPNLGDKAEERVIALIEGYWAFLKGEDHPALRHSNRELLVGEPEGMVLVGLEKLLLDLASLPLARWLRTHAFRLEALLQEGQRPSSPRLREE